MDTHTGRIYEGNLEDVKRRLGHDDIVEIDPGDMTEKQRKEKRVSLHDRRSKLGKILTRNQRRNRRKQLAKIDSHEPT